VQVSTASLVYEKEKNLRMMMRMHGLGDGAYWLISYAYFMAVSAVYIGFFVVFGSIISEPQSPVLAPQTCNSRAPASV